MNVYLWQRLERCQVTDFYFQWVCVGRRGRLLLIKLSVTDIALSWDLACQGVLKRNKGPSHVSVWDDGGGRGRRQGSS